MVGGLCSFSVSFSSLALARYLCAPLTWMPAISPALTLLPCYSPSTLSCPRATLPGPEFYAQSTFLLLGWGWGVLSSLLQKLLSPSAQLLPLLYLCISS